MSKKKQLGLCLIVKDEQDFLKSCIDSVKDIVDEIVVVDTGSTDKTPEIAKELGAKLYFYEWDNSFSNARNFAISKCKAEWLLILDADEALFKEDRQKLLDFIKTKDYDAALFKVYNYVGERMEVGYSIHNATRLVRNNGQYLFKGDIHEQIHRVDGAPVKRIALTDIRLHHYGYLNNVIKKKDKRARNIPIVLKELEQNPENAFMLFNLGNEYMAKRQFDDAVKCFYKAMEFAKPAESFCPHLYFRCAICLQNMSRFKEALEILERGLKLYPGCTDMELLRGYIYSDMRLDLMAIKSFNKAIEMGEPHATIRFTDDCATIRPLMALAEVYLRQKDFAAAEEACVKVVNLNNKVYAVLYKLVEIAKIRGDSEEVVAARMEPFFGSLELVPNLLLLVDLMLQNGYYKNAQKYIMKAEAGNAYKRDLGILKAKLHFFMGEHEQAHTLLKQYFEDGKGVEILIDLAKEAVMLFACLNLIRIFKGQEQSIYESLNDKLKPSELLVLSQSQKLINGEEVNLLGDQDPETCLAFLAEILKRILTAREFDLFEKLLYNYNYIESKKVLLHLAKIYYDCGYKKFAFSSIIDSVKQLNTIDLSGARLLLDSMF